jgi:predicted CoA-substrate-specific enzyme activase
MIEQNVDILLDIGSRFVKAVAADGKATILQKIYRPVKGGLAKVIKSVLLSIYEAMPGRECTLKALTGSNTHHYSKVFNLEATNGILSTYLGAKKLVENAGSILEIAGEHTTFIRLTRIDDDQDVLKDFFSNSECSSGTGAFLEQEAHRLNLTIEEFSRLASLSTQAARVAGRCAVFAKTDMVHLHQTGFPLPDICYSLCLSLAQNIVNELILSREYTLPLAVVGGVAANTGILKALKGILNLNDKSLIVPPDHLYAAAIGASLVSKELRENGGCRLIEAMEKIDGHQRPVQVSILKPLHPSPMKIFFHPPELKKCPKEIIRNDIFLGIDIGSTSTNFVCTDSKGNIYWNRTLPTQGKALPTVLLGLSFLKENLGIFKPKAVGITGSGRKFIAEVIGADAVLNEITAHFLGGRHSLLQVDTIIDIGGQDSKFIRIEDGTVVDFEMNKVCSAGTGSFLEEMSELIGLKIEDEFAHEAFRSKKPVDLGERCTVFMSTELMRKLQEGEDRKDLAAGLCYSVVKNYISRVVGRKKTGKHISFQGGVASNPAIVSALERILQKPVSVHQNHEIAGALGAALFASQKEITESRFRGFECLESRSIQTESFNCQKCSNNCSICFTRDLSGDRCYSGGLCDRYEEKISSVSEAGKKRLDLFKRREDLLHESVRQSDPADSKDCFGIPRALLFYDLIPFWATFFNELGLKYRFSDPTSKKTVSRGLSICPTNPCLPLKTAYGHCLQLIEEGVDKIFIPSVSNLAFLTKKERMNHICPAAQAWPFTARSLFADKIDFLTPTVRFSIPRFFESDIAHFGKSLGFSGPKVSRAFRNAMGAQNDFYESAQETGRRVFSDHGNNMITAVLLSRPYTVCDPIIWLQLKKIFDSLNIAAIPIDMVPCRHKYSRELDGMYWYFGKRYLQAIEALENHPNSVFIHLSNFGCGADSFIVHFLRQRLQNKPFLELEIDEHNQFTGVSTRLEAFFLSLKKRPLKKIKDNRPLPKVQASLSKSAKLLIPQMSIHAVALQSTFRAYGVDAEVLPLPDQSSICEGKQVVTGGECLPCSFVIGDILKNLKNHPSHLPYPTFFMMSGDGPCRLGQYPYFQRKVLDEQGYSDVQIFDATQDQAFYDRFGIFPAKFKREAWQKVVAVDLLFRKWREVRPFVDEKVEFDAVFSAEIRSLCDIANRDGNLSRRLNSSFERFDAFIDQPREQKPIVAVLGENYIRCNPIANGKVADLLEELGAEVWFPSLYEWAYYGNWTARLHCLYERKLKKFLKLYLIDAVQHWDEHKIARKIHGKLRNLKEPSLAQNFNMSSKYMSKTFEGETLIEVARSVDFFNKGVSGVVRVVPFGCMMGTIVETLSEQISRDLSDFPIMTLHYDGQDYRSQIDKLEGFMIRARMWEKSGRIHENLSLG